MFLFHLALGVSTLSIGKIDMEMQLYRTAIDFRERNGTGWDLVPIYVAEGVLYPTVLTALFFALSSLFHLLNATLLHSYYIKQLEKCRTPTRWVEYSLSAPVMMLLLAYSLGIRERALLFCLAVLVGITMPFGYWVETRSRPLSVDEWTLPLATRLLPWFIGHIPQTVAWTVVVVQLYDGNIDPNDSVPWWVYLILWAELLLFFSFGFASLLSQWGPPSLFYRGELAFQVLSLVSKGLLGIVLLTNVLMLSRFDEIYE